MNDTTAGRMNGLNFLFRLAELTKQVAPPRYITPVTSSHFLLSAHAPEARAVREDRRPRSRREPHCSPSVQRHSLITWPAQCASACHCVTDTLFHIADDATQRMALNQPEHIYLYKQTGSMNSRQNI